MEDRERKKHEEETPENELCQSAVKAMEKAVGFEHQHPLPTYPISKKIPKKFADMVGK